jgi:hypothetical protein
MPGQGDVLDEADVPYDRQHRDAFRRRKSFCRERLQELSASK